MNKKLIFFVAGLATVAGASAFIPRTVQGIPYTPKGVANEIATASDNPFDPGHDLAVPEGDFTFDMIESWTGEGSNRAALVIQWNDPKEDCALVFGYRWDGLATGADMIRAVVADHPQLYSLIQYTNVSSPTDPLGGYTINGFGWDRDGDEDIALKDDKDNQIYTSENGLFIHPRGYDPDKGGSSDYDYDDWKAVDEDDFWGAGWYVSYWSYWVKGSQDSSFGYSGWGASGRVLEDGCWDGWNFSLDMIPRDWKKFKAAPDPLPEGVETEFKVGGLYYNLTNYNLRKVALVAPFEIEGEALTDYSGDITVPATITVDDDTYSVTKIKSSAFANAQIGKLTLPSSISKIGDYAFSGSSLQELILAENAAVPSLGKGVFSGCANFSQFILPEGLKAIPDELYKGTSLSEIIIPDDIEEIGVSVFEDCTKITSLDIPKSIQSIGAKAFSGCSAIENVMVNSIYPPECSEDAFGEITADGAELKVPIGYSSAYAAAPGWSVFKTTSEFGIPVNPGDKFIANGIAYIVSGIGDDGNTVKVTYQKTDNDKTDNSSIKAANKTGYSGDVVIPNSVSYQGISFDVTALDEKCFYYASNLESVVLPEGITTIPADAFNSCSNLNHIDIPSSVKEIATYAFTYCSKLDQVDLPVGLTTLGVRSFQSTGISSINLPDGVTEIPQYCFYGTPLTSVILGDGITSLGSNCFQSCSKLQTVKLPAHIKTLPSSIFYSCSSLSEIVIPDEVSKIESSAFYGCSALEGINIPDSVSSLGSGIFQNCSALKEVKIPAKISTLPTSLFQGCSALEKVTISPEVTALPSNIFSGCRSLNSISFYGDSTVSSPGVIRLNDNLKSIAQYAFQNCTAVKEVILPEGLTTLGGRDIFKETGITELIIPASVTSMNQNYICENNENVTFYICGTSPVTVNRFTFAKASGNYAFPIIVPSGYADTFKSASNWNYYTISEPVVESLALSDMKLSDGTLSGCIGVNYDIELPERFARVNNGIALEGYTLTVTLSGEGMEPVSVDITPASDGIFSVEIDGFKGRNGVSAIAHASKGESNYGSQPADVEVAVNVPFSFAQAEYNAHFDEQFTPELNFDNEDYTLSDINFSSLNSDVAYVNKRTGAVSVKRVEGDAVIRAFVVKDPDIYAEMTVHAALATPVEGFILGDGTKNITMSYMDIYALCPAVEPANADIQSYDIEISDPTVATTYSVTAFNPTRKYFELVTHKPGEVDVTFKAQDGSEVETTYHFIIQESDRSEAKDSWQDGTFWLNEDWFGHTNGSINYIEKDGTVRYRAYESQNPYESFGCTSQYAMIFGGKLYVMSKQETDGGDTRRGGGRLVVADAKTLKKLAGFDDILDGGDGRACVGVNSQKVYIGTTAGIAIFDPQTLSITGSVKGIETGSKYANQLGDMVCAGKYVFAIKQAYGTYVIDTETDQVVKVLGRNEDGSVFANPQGVTMTADGMVWIAATSTANGKATTLYCYDPSGLELVKSVDMPSHLSITCGWGAWRSTNFFAEKDKVAIWFGSGVEASIVSGNSGYYRWDTKSDVSELEPVFVFPNDLAGMDEKTKQAPYATVRYDDRSNQLLIATTHGSSSNYRYTWLHFVDCSKGEIARTIRLKDYYWFPALPVFPDKYAPEFDELESIELDMVNDKEGKIIEIPVTDRDNMDIGIKLSIVENDPEDVEGIALYASSERNPVVETSLQDNKLTVIPLRQGSDEISLRAESNGVATYLSLPVNVKDLSSDASLVVEDNSVMSVSGRRFYSVGFKGHIMLVYNANGVLVAEFEVMDDKFSIDLPLEKGVYFITDRNSNRKLKFMLK